MTITLLHNLLFMGVFKISYTVLNVVIYIYLYIIAFILDPSKNSCSLAVTDGDPNK